MAADDTAATTAKRKQLEAQLSDALKSLEDSYYSHQMSSREEALDKELSDFEEQKQKEIEGWEEYAENVDQVVSDCLEYVKANTSEVYSTLSNLGQDYSLTLSDSLITPWQSGSNAIDSYSENFETAISSFTKQLDSIVLHWEEVTAAAEAAATAQAKALQAEYNATASKVPSTITGNSSSNTSSAATKPSTSTTTPTTTTTTKAITTGSKVKVASTDHIYSSPGVDAGLQYFRSDPQYIILGEKDGYYKVRWYKLSSGVTGWFPKGRVSAAYAKGLKKAKSDHLALTDELGPELKLVAGSNGSLEYVKYGSSILPNDISSKLIDFATDPTSIFDDITPKFNVPNVISSATSMTLNVDKAVNIEHADSTSIPEIKKAVNDQLEAYQKKINSALKRV